MKFLPALFLCLPALAAPEEFADVQRLDFQAVVALRWAQAETPMGRPVYPESRCLLRRPVAEAVSRAQAVLLIEGYRVILHDCYRPLSLDRVLREKLGKGAGPETHTTGGAVALGLVDAKSGVAVDMPTPYASTTADRSWTSSRRKRAKKNAARLRGAMEREGFRSFGAEWWRFEWAKATYPAEDFAFADVPAKGR